MANGPYRLDNWTLINHGTWSQLEGNVFGNPKFHDGAFIRTSWLRAFSVPEGKATTKNSVYLLGTPAGLALGAQDEDKAA
jgi:hypothetical protein